MTTIPKSFKKIIFVNLKASIKHLLVEHPTIKNQLNIPLDPFSISYKLRPKKEVGKFNQDLILSKYYTLIRPKLQILSDSTTELAQSAFNYFIDDFYEYAIYKCVESEDAEKMFNDIWNQFELDFYASELEIQYLARLKNLYYHGGIGLDNIIPWAGVDGYWTHTAFDYRLLGWERQGGIHYNFLENFYPSWMVLRMKKKISFANAFISGISEAVDKFSLFTFIVRNVSGGNVYFNDIRLFCLGHYSPFSNLGSSSIPVCDNDIYEEIGEYTTLEHPWDWSISKALKKCENVSYSQFIFADWQIRLKGALQTPKEMEESNTKRKYYLYNNLLCLTFVLNSLLPDMGNRKNKSFREDYLPILIHRLFGMTEGTTKQAIKNLYEIRNCIAHGKNQDADKELASKYGTLDKLKEELRIFEYILNQLILLSMVNGNLKIILEQWYNTGNSTLLPSLDKPFSDL
jgi:hypothetical protein